MADDTGRTSKENAGADEGERLPKRLRLGNRGDTRGAEALPAHLRLSKEGKPAQSPDPIKFDLNKPEPEEQISRTRAALRKDGYDEATVNSLTNRPGLGAAAPSDLDIGALYDTHMPAASGDAAVSESTWKVSQQLKDEDGVAISALDWSLMRNYIGIFNSKDLTVGNKGTAMLSETRSFWKKAQRQIGDQLAGTVAEGVMNFTHGLAMLDGMSWINKKFKLLFVPESAAKAELEARVLPKIILDDGHEYQTGTSAGMHVLGQRMAGFGMKAVAVGLRATPVGLISLLPNSPLKDIVDSTAGRLQAAGQAKQDVAVGQVPNLIASLGPHLSWQEVVERNWEPVMDLDNFYAGLNDMGLYGDIAMGAMALGDGLGEIIFDPVLIFGASQARVPSLLRGVVGRLAPGKHAAITSEIARRTNRLEDALDAVKAATADLEKAETLGRQQAASTEPARMSTEAAKKIVQKRAQLAHEKQWLSTFEDAGPNEQIILRSARRSEEALPPTSKIEEYVDLVQGKGGPTPVRGEFPIKKQAALFAEFEELQKGVKTMQNRERISEIADELGKLGVLTDDEASVVGKLVIERQNLQALRKSVKGKGGKPVADRLKEVSNEIDNVLEKGRQSFILLNKVTKTRKVPREINEVVKELDEMRRLALSRDADMAIDFNKVDDLPLFQKRIILGPDDVEQSGDAMNHIIRTGGVGIDDVATTPTAIEYRGLPGSQQGLINWRALNLQNDIVKAEREFNLINKQYTLGTSSRRVIARQVHQARKSLGLLRKQNSNLPGNKLILDKIRVFEKELVNLKAAGKKLPKDMKDDFDASWLPKDTPGVMDTPARYNTWLEKAGDTAIRSLYPGGLITANFGNTKMGQIIAPLREPQRFMETYDPALWDRVRSGHLRQRQMQTAMFDDVTAIAEEAGIMTRRSKWNPKKDWNEFKIDQKRNEQLFDLLDEPAGSEAHIALLEAADPRMVKAHDKVRKILEHAADQQGISDTNKYITGYIRHTITKDQFAGGARPIEYIGLPTKSEVFASHLLDRNGVDGYPRDALLAMDFYSRSMSRKIVAEPLFEDIIKSGGELAKKHNNPMFQTYMNDLVHSMKGKPQFVGRKVDEIVGGALNADGKARWQPGKIDRVLGGMTGLMYTGALGANPRYPIMQIATGIATTAGRFGIMRTSRALWSMATKEGQATNKAIGTYTEFLDIFESDFARKLTTAIAKNVPAITPMGVMTTAQTETYIRGVTAHAAIDMYMTKFGFASWGEARAAGFADRIAFEALRSAEEVNHMFGALGRSATATRTLAPTKGTAISATQFLSFIPKQTEELLSQMNRSPGKIIEYMSMSGWISRIAAEELGIDLTSYVGLGYGPENPTDMTSPAVDVFIKGMDVMEAMSKHDPKATSDAVTAYLSSAQTLIPLIVAFESAGKAAERLATGEQKSVLGEKQRKLDFMDVLGDAPEGISDDRFPGLQKGQASGLEQLAQAIRPSADPERAAQDPMAGLGGDVIPIMGMQQSIRENVHRRGVSAAKREQRRFAFNMQKTVRNYLDALDDGDEAKMDILEDELADTFKIRLTGEGPVAKAAMAREISWTLRNIMNNEVMMDRFLKIYEDFGLEITE